jgi:hypothetical protein
VGVCVCVCVCVERFGTLYVSRRQRVTIDGHEHSWAQQELIITQTNERRFQVRTTPASVSLEHRSVSYWHPVLF